MNKLVQKREIEAKKNAQYAVPLCYLILFALQLSFIRNHLILFYTPGI